MSLDGFPFNCPSCGAGIERKLKYVKLIVCPHCQTSLFLEDDGVRKAGKMSVLTDQPSVLEIAHPFVYQGWTFIPRGRVRYDYSQGFWDEWWVMGNDGKDKWISVDEGDVAIENRFDAPADIPRFASFGIGQEIQLDNQQLIVTEKNSSVCVGAEGELPIKIEPQEKNDYIDFSGQNSTVYRIRYFSNRIECYKGKWIDIFELRRI